METAIEKLIKNNMKKYSDKNIGEIFEILNEYRNVDILKKSDSVHIKYDIVNNRDDMMIYFEIPGVDKKSLQIFINNSMTRDLINKSKQILEQDSLENEEQELLNEISVGKLSTTVFVGRLKLLTRKIKDVVMRKTFMTLGYMIYTVSLQSKSLQKIDDKLDKITQELKRQQIDLERVLRKK